MEIAFATCRAMPDGYEDDHAAARAVGATFAVWDDPGVDWGAFDRVVIRSVWDYTADADAFVAWCRAVGVERLRNDPELVAFNADKRYLGTLPVATVPTVFVGPGDALPALDGEVVVKPNVSAGARDTGRFGPATHADALDLITDITASGRTALVQPYLDDVDARGELGLVHFDGVLSHVLRKRAVLRPDEIAPVAEDHDLAVAAAMLEDDLVVPGVAEDGDKAFARTLLEHVAGRFGGAMPLYARVDIAHDPDGAPVLMELEVIEPCLYLDLVDGAAERFAAAIAAG